MASSSSEQSVVCHICGTAISRKADLPRHMRLHSQNKEQMLYHCPYNGCTYKSLQKSNVDTHIRTHTGEKNQQCPDCEFTTADPGSLTRHRKRIHGYTPRPRKPRQAQAQATSAAGGKPTTKRNVNTARAIRYSPYALYEQPVVDIPSQTSFEELLSSLHPLLYTIPSSPSPSDDASHTHTHTSGQSHIPDSCITPNVTGDFTLPRDKITDGLSPLPMDLFPQQVLPGADAGPLGCTEPSFLWDQGLQYPCESPDAGVSRLYPDSLALLSFATMSPISSTNCAAHIPETFSTDFVDWGNLLAAPCTSTLDEHAWFAPMQFNASSPSTESNLSLPSESSISDEIYGQFLLNLGA